VRLFTAVVPPVEVADHLEAFLKDLPERPYWAPRDAWHITLGYYGTEEPASRIPWVGSRLAGLARPRISLGRPGNFRDTLLMTVSTKDSALTGLAMALRWDDKHPTYIPHLTIGKGEPLDVAYSGPEWTVDEVLLLGAEQRHDYTVVERYSLD
jgi:RNA 2',3'-cyclic 3'-phosphodiesterase